jgi:hypothetical protein
MAPSHQIELELRVPESTGELLRRCVALSRAGADFPAVWQSVLKGHRLVAGIPVQSMSAGRSRLEIPLLTHQRVVYDPDGREYSIL